MVFKVTKAVIPAAGLGTRFLPATKAMPKEMLPVVDKPAIQYVVEEAVSAKLRDVLIITGRNKDNLMNHFDSVPELENQLQKKGDTERLSKVTESTDLADVHFVRQGEARGLGHAVLRAKMHVKEEPFAVLLGDDLIDERDYVLPTMIAQSEKRHATIIALMEVNPEQIHLYGAARVEPTEEENLVRVRGLVEKPNQEDAPSNLAIIGRYVLRPEIFSVLEKTEPGRGNEIQLTDAINTLAVDDTIAGPVFGIIFKGRRYDTGDRADWIKASIQLAVERDDIGEELKVWLKDFVEKM